MMEEVFSGTAMSSFFVHISCNASKYKVSIDHLRYKSPYLDITCTKISTTTISSFMHENPLTIHATVLGGDGVFSFSAAESEALD